VSAFDFDLVFIGGGPGGYVAAIRARQLGLRVAVVEKEKVGGVCLNIGCIPSKALIDRASKFNALHELAEYSVKVDLSAFDYSGVQAFSRKAADKLSKGVEFLLKKNEVETIAGTARLTGAHELSIALNAGGERRIKSLAIVIATGSRPREVPGFEFDERRVLSSTGALMLKKLPRRLAILGAGAIGMEFAFIMNAFGVEVTVVEMLERILPMEDSAAASVAGKAFERRGVKFLVGTKAFSLDRGSSDGSPLVLSLGPAASAVPDTKLEADAVLVSIGRSPNTGGLGLEEIGVRLDRSFVEVGDYYETAASGIYAIGDIVKGEPQLAHVASAQGEIVAERVASLLYKQSTVSESHASLPHRRVDLGLIPSAVYCEPQVAGFGLREEALKASGVKCNSASFPFRGVGKAVAIDEAEGFVKILTDPATGAILSAFAVGPEATELIHELLLAKSSELLPQDIYSMIHAHPTLSEAVKEASLAVEGRAIHT